MWKITGEEIALTRQCIQMCLDAGASQARASLNKSMMDLVLLRDGQLDKVSHSGDRSLTFNIYAAGRYGTFSTNRLTPTQLEAFIREAVEKVKLLEEDPFRKLADPSRTCKSAIEGGEMGIYDCHYEQMDAEKRLEAALKASHFAKAEVLDGCSLISEETEFSDSMFDIFVCDSQGTSCRHYETAFEIGVEATVMDASGQRQSAFQWDSQPFFKDLAHEGCGERAFRRAVMQAAPSREFEGGKMNMVISNEASHRVLTPVLAALNAFAVYQKNSFMRDALGQRVFPEGLCICDRPVEKGRNGARLFDSEGVATKDTAIIENGVVKQFFVNTYMAGKMGVEPTSEDSTRACILPWRRDGGPLEALDAEKIMKLCGNGVLVTGFNGGNCSKATGDFSYGVEGFLFEEGKIVCPVSEVLITGNMLSLWDNLLVAGSDPRSCYSRQIPTLAFKDVDFSA